MQGEFTFDDFLRSYKVCAAWGRSRGSLIPA
jgi:hypothetical protein